MRPTTLVFAASLALACSPPGFNVPVSGEGTIPASPLPGVLNALPTLSGFTNLDFDQSQTFRNEGITKDQVSSVRLTSLTLTIESPDTQDFDFLEYIEFYAQTGDQEALIADRRNIASLGLTAPYPTLILETKSVELAPYVTAPSMNVIARGRGTYPASETVIRADALFFVQLKLF